METRYNVYFAGQLLEGHELTTVRGRLASLFKADEATLDKLFSGQAQLVKRDCDRDTAQKYQQALERAGALPIIKAIPQAEPEPGEPAAKKLTAAERIAMLAAAPDLMPAEASAGQAPTPEPITQPTPGPDAEDADPDGLSLLASGVDVLRPEERQEPVESAVTAPELEIDAAGQRLSSTPSAPPPAPDTSHLSTAEVGELLPGLPSETAPLSPDTSALDLAPEGTDLSDSAAPKAPVLELDLSAIDLAPAGSEVLEQQYRKHEDTPPPTTDHFSLDD